MLYRGIVDDTFHIVFTLGYCLGARLLRYRPSEDSASKLTRRLGFVCMILCYLFGTVILIFLSLPIPDADGVIVIKIDVYTAYAVIWACFMLDGFLCFITINFSAKYLLDESGYTARCREAALIASLDQKTLKSWKRITMYIIFIFVFVLGALVVVTTLAATHVAAAPVQMERVVYWSSLPMWLAWAVCGVVAALATVHIGYHCIFFCNQCEITRLHFRTFADTLLDEKAATFTKTRIDLFHAEYCRLIEMVQHLDTAFRYSTLCQLSLVTVGSCLILFMFTTQGAEDWQAMIFIVFTLSTIVFTFCFTAIPAILLDGQVYRPKALLRAWFFNYERHCNIYERTFNETARHAMALFMQSVNSEDAGITIASLAKLNPQLLLTLASVVMTYFLVIVQFEQQNCATITNLTQTCMANGFELAASLRRNLSG